jgi:hypothetical protein
VVIPDVIIADIARHLRNYVEAEPDSVVFTGAKGAPLRRSHWAPAWREAIVANDMTGFRFHDLRHTGNTMAAAAGASTKELMARMGHSSPAAALRYQHATLERERVIAASLNANIEAGLAKVIQLPRRTADDLHDARETVSLWHANGTPAEISREITPLRPRNHR